MPELYGHPFKHELYKEIDDLKSELWNERKEHSNTRSTLRYASAKIAALEAKIERMADIGDQLRVEAKQVAVVLLKRRELASAG
jgi:hypothetical protein